VLRVREELRELGVVEVGDADRAREARVLDALHRRPRAADVTLCNPRRVDEVQIHVRQAQLRAAGSDAGKEGREGGARI
jgi:hypothetical protein